MGGVHGDGMLFDGMGYGCKLSAWLPDQIAFNEGMFQHFFASLNTYVMTA